VIQAAVLIALPLAWSVNARASQTPTPPHPNATEKTPNQQ